MTAKKILSVTSVLLLVAFYGCDNQREETSRALGDRSEIVVAMDIDMPGYFAADGEVYGLQYDLLKAYADDAGFELKIIENTTLSDKRELFRKDEADIAASLSSQITDGANEIPLYNTSFVMLAEKRGARRFNADAVPHISNILRGKKLLVSSAFKSTGTYRMLSDSLKNDAEVFVSSRSCVELARSLRNGEYDYMICEKSEAQIAQALVLGISKVYDFNETAGVSIALNPKVGGLKENFTEWLERYRGSNDYATLTDLYFKDGSLSALPLRSHDNKLRRGISDYDHIMRDVCEREGLDWRLMSAIAFHESRFNANVVSNRGASGLMQIMPAVARQFDVEQQDILKPEVNITLATKLLGRIEKSLRLPDGMPYKDRMSIVLACYNCGIGHVSDARRLASKHGGNPNSWQDVSFYLQRKSEPEYVSDDVVKCGRLSSGGSRQTLAFVDNVMSKYNSYCSVIKR